MGHFVSQLAHLGNVFVQLGEHVIHVRGKTGGNGGKRTYPNLSWREEKTR